MSLKSKIQALITAANTTTGESATDLTGAVQDLVDGYGQGGTPVINPLSVTANGTYTAPSGVDGYSPVTVNVSGGGGSLPSVISKIDGGSFTVASDTDCRDYDIAHNLGTVPKAFVVWTEDITMGEAQPIIYLIRIHYFDTGYNATTVSTNLALRVSTSGTSVAGGAGIAAAAVSNWVTSAKICANYNTNYKACITYKWLAWA